MGVKMNGDEKTVLLGLSYNKKAKKWTLLCGVKTNSEKPSSKSEAEKTYQVAIVLRNGTQGSAYVDGESVGEATCELKNKDPKGISHFYIGGDGGSAGSQEGVSVTVANVLLYNRPLSSGEITALTTKLPIQKQKDVETRGAWAEWPVGKQGENQLYHFANYNFTLVATVSIDGEPTQEGSIPLMGVKMNGDEKTVLLGLSYNKKAKKWTLLCGVKNKL
ncbi:trans-sialidase, putative [Trypanosoma cruzi marinkellei]|uniref:Trans-sialidase, putative n=1 Tax=Trypanosoma cruzi marinkellei TaxID=85056 RepID=K2LTY4_TRYCR|nr:trans-sialidase, putative [Trypanosoma cruzi marinkellei]